MRRIRFEGISKKLDGEQIINDLSLEIPGGKFFALLGPSGCGKTTLLRLLAGLETVDKGKVFLGEQDITNVPIYERRVHTVFQNYALFPHLNVFENIAYSLRVKGLPDKKIRERVEEILSVVRLKQHQAKRIQSSFLAASMASPRRLWSSKQRTVRIKPASALHRPCSLMRKRRMRPTGWRVKARRKRWIFFRLF